MDVLCPICLEKDQEELTEPVLTSCGHIFCWPCIFQSVSVQGKDDCPVCRTPLITIISDMTRGRQRMEGEFDEVPPRPVTGVDPFAGLRDHAPQALPVPPPLQPPVQLPFQTPFLPGDDPFTQPQSARSVALRRSTRTRSFNRQLRDYDISNVPGNRIYDDMEISSEVGTENSEEERVHHNEGTVSDDDVGSLSDDIDRRNVARIGEDDMSFRDLFLNAAPGTSGHVSREELPVSREELPNIPYTSMFSLRNRSPIMSPSQTHSFPEDTNGSPPRSRSTSNSPNHDTLQTELSQTFTNPDRDGDDDSGDESEALRQTRFKGSNTVPGSELSYLEVLSEVVRDELRNSQVPLKSINWRAMVRVTRGKFERAFEGKDEKEASHQCSRLIISSKKKFDNMKRLLPARIRLGDLRETNLGIVWTDICHLLSRAPPVVMRRNAPTRNRLVVRRTLRGPSVGRIAPISTMPPRRTDVENPPNAVENPPNVVENPPNDVENRPNDVENRPNDMTNRLNDRQTGLPNRQTGVQNRQVRVQNHPNPRISTTPRPNEDQNHPTEEENRVITGSQLREASLGQYIQRRSTNNTRISSEINNINNSLGELTRTRESFQSNIFGDFGRRIEDRAEIREIERKKAEQNRLEEIHRQEVRQDEKRRMDLLMIAAITKSPDVTESLNPREIMLRRTIDDHGDIQSSPEFPIKIKLESLYQLKKDIAEYVSQDNYNSFLLVIKFLHAETCIITDIKQVTISSAEVSIKIKHGKQYFVLEEI